MKWNFWGRLATMLVALLCVPASAVFAVGDTRGVPAAGGNGEVLLVMYTLSDPSLSASTCTRPGFGFVVENACGNQLAWAMAGRAATITHIDIALVEGHLFTTTEGCEVDIDIGGVTAATFLVGAPALDVAGEFASQTKPLVTTRNPADRMIVRHDNPTDATWCNAGAGCLCTGAGPGSWIVEIWGIPL